MYTCLYIHFNKHSDVLMASQLRVPLFLVYRAAASHQLTLEISSYYQTCSIYEVIYQ